jgi:hypothetical protein
MMPSSTFSVPNCIHLKVRQKKTFKKWLLIFIQFNIINQVSKTDILFEYSRVRRTLSLKKVIKMTVASGIRALPRSR